MSEEKKKLRPTLRTSIVTSGQMFEEVCFNNQFLYLVHDFKTGKNQHVPNLPWDPLIYLPVEDHDGVEYHHFYLAEKPMPYDPEELDKEIFDHFDHWCDYPKDFKHLDVAYSKLTWVFDELQTVPYRRALSTLWGTGKSRWVECLLSTSRLGFKQGATPTAAGVYRKAHIYRGTQSFDENEYSGLDDVSRVIQFILNTSYQKSTGIITRCVPPYWTPKSFVCYGPKLIAARQGFADVATESRTISHRAYKSRSVPLELDKSFYEDAQKIRNKLLQWRIDHLFNIPPEIKTFEEHAINHKLDPRLIEVSKPLTRFITNETQLRTLANVMEHANEMVEAWIDLTTTATMLRAIAGLLDDKDNPVLSMKNISDWINTNEQPLFPMTPKTASHIIRTELDLLVSRRWDTGLNTSPFTLILTGQYVKCLIDRLNEYKMPIPVKLATIYRRQQSLLEEQH